ncbi:MAG: histidine--tRNA ligase [Candidatus Bathyarchaeota archaeon]|nr:histidine--tRNA ligase [Candidatus Bathyarchaeota archaeon]
MPTFQTVRGMRDLLPGEAEALNNVIARTRETARLYGYREVITPVVESYELLSAKSGEEIRQRMFTFKDLGDRMVALRPEFTASIARLATTALRNEPKPLRVFSVGSVYRYDEPQRGRYREFWQANFELIGSSTPEADVEILLLTKKVMNSIGLRNFSFKVGHVGVIRGILSQEGIDEKIQNLVLQRMDKKEYSEAFKLIEQDKCRKVLRGLLELKGDTPFETAEKIQQYVSGYEMAQAAASNLIAILHLATVSGCPIKTVETAFARGLEYYTGVIFEVNVPELDVALGGGGRYDKLIEVFGGEPTPAVGVAHGLDRIVLALQAQKISPLTQRGKTTMVIPVKPELRAEALKLAQMLRESGISVEFEVMGRKMAKALEDADKRKVDYAVIVGEQELKEGMVVVRDLAKREQTTVEISKLTEKLRA